MDKIKIMVVALILTIFGSVIWVAATAKNYCDFYRYSMLRDVPVKCLKQYLND